MTLASARPIAGQSRWPPFLRSLATDAQRTGSPRVVSLEKVKPSTTCGVILSEAKNLGAVAEIGRVKGGIS